MSKTSRSDTFIDPTSKREFRRFNYFDHDVIQDVETGRINAGKFVLDISRANGKEININQFRLISDYKLALEYCRARISIITSEPDSRFRKNLKIPMLLVHEIYYFPNLILEEL